MIETQRAHPLSREKNRRTGWYGEAWNRGVGVGVSKDADLEPTGGVVKAGVGVPPGGL